MKPTVSLNVQPDSLQNKPLPRTLLARTLTSTFVLTVPNSDVSPVSQAKIPIFVFPASKDSPSQEPNVSPSVILATTPVKVAASNVLRNVLPVLTKIPAQDAPKAISFQIQLAL
jgi:hypothetical protein